MSSKVFIRHLKIFPDFQEAYKLLVELAVCPSVELNDAEEILGSIIVVLDTLCCR